MKTFDAQFGQAVDYLRSFRFGGDGAEPMGLMLGTGMSSVIDIIDIERRVALAEIPGLPSSSVAFQSPSFISGRIGDAPVVCADGRFHFYEGHSMREVVSIVYVMRELGVKRLIINSAVGGINKDYEQGDLVMVNDHINLSTANPLIGLKGEDGKMLFPNMIDAYHKETGAALKTAAAANAVMLKEGVLAYLPGPAFETRAELRLLRALGADLIGWSMVPEVSFARALGMEVAGICCVSDISNPDTAAPANLDDIVEACRSASERLSAILLRTMDGVSNNIVKTNGSAINL
ncbi:MAG: purine-nucleoside phosphorylase [Deltaproteobacteria bacterium]|nr:purine-nucleoside phosphorylase [Deltaproteobacteria bacterium]